MRNVYNLSNLKPCDRLVLPKRELGLIQHHAIFIGTDAYGSNLYIENGIGKGVQIVDEKHLFRDGYNLTRVEIFQGNTLQRNIALNRAMGLVGKPYDLINFNCEHYANTVQHNRCYSKQVYIGIISAFLVLILFINFLNNRQWERPI